MSEDRQGLVERAYEAINARDWVGLDALINPDFEFLSAFAAMEGGTAVRGGRGVRGLIEDNFDAIWEDLRFTVESVRHSGNRSAVTVRVTGVAAGSGVPLNQRIGQVWTWRGDQPVRADGYTNVADALEAVGLSE